MSLVRKHRAPKGSLRRADVHSCRSWGCRFRRPRAPDGALRPFAFLSVTLVIVCRKAPSAKRCIKTSDLQPQRFHARPVRKHRAPKGALRPSFDFISMGLKDVRKHRAPKGALRRNIRALHHILKRGSESTERQTVH